MPSSSISIHALLAESDVLRRDISACHRDFYPRSPCGERRYCHRYIGFLLCISIHALLAESDDVACGYWHKLHHFYPRSPCGERRYCHRYIGFLLCISIHALLAESDWCGDVTGGHQKQFLSTLSLRRATGRNCNGFVGWHFYPRSPCGERLVFNAVSNSLVIFLSTLSLRRATRSAGPWQAGYMDFYPRSPCGERRMLMGSRDSGL